MFNIKKRYLIINILLIFLSIIIIPSLATSKVKDSSLSTEQSTDVVPPIIKPNQQNEQLIKKYFAPILVFHHIGNAPLTADKGTKGLFVDESNFEKILAELQKNNYHSVFASEVADYLVEGKKLPENIVSLNFDDGYEDFYTQAFPLLKKYNMSADLFVITGMTGGDYLTEDQIQEIDKSNLVEIGSHTVSHAQLPKLKKEEQIKELEESKKTLEKLLNKKIELICYPYGAYNKQVEDLAKLAGYKYGFTYNQKPLSDTTDVFAIDRTSVWQGKDVIKFLDGIKKMNSKIRL
ncbi:MAG: polysaccharide deacetylase family protein, partial [Candidatus Falkowbacteria bacterium]|nr:polysaccharide deacetylase family protein [Candidatus Falkowbacteria bacterium]